MAAKHLFLPHPRTTRARGSKKLANGNFSVLASWSGLGLVSVLGPLALLEWGVSRMGSHLHVSRLGIVFIVAFTAIFYGISPHVPLILAANFSPRSLRGGCVSSHDRPRKGTVYS